MTEQKDFSPLKEGKEEQTTPNINAPSSPEQDFSGIGNMKLNDLEATQPKESVISQLNAEEQTKAPKEELKLENLGMRIQPTEGEVRNVSLGSSGVMGGKMSKYHNQYRRLFLISFFIVLVTGIGSIILRLYSRYVYFSSQATPSATYQTYINIYKQ